MQKTLIIEINSETEDSMISILEHIVMEIKNPGKYKNNNIENGCYLKNGWLVIEDGVFKGKYRWKKD